ncbi:MAG: hypothetical protein LBQ88_21300 [Treponema sp.]|jgi:hypothetical protein|nr:hypothetical protein [Treponema sp.]
MTEISIAVSMLEELRPKLGKRIIHTLILVGCVWPFEGLFLGSAAMIKNLVISSMGFITVILIWVDYRLKINKYLKFKDELIDLTDKMMRTPANIMGS